MAAGGPAISGLGACLLWVALAGGMTSEAGVDGSCTASAGGDSSLEAWLNATSCPDIGCVLTTAYPDEQEAWRHTGDSSEIYGEVTVLGMKKLLDVFSWGPQARFYDLGCGTGRLVLYASLTQTLARAVGVEKVSARLLIGQKAADSLKSMAPATSAWVRPELLDADFADMDFSDATAVYLSSLYFPDDVLRMLAERLSGLQDGALIASMVRFPHSRKRQALPEDSPLHNLHELQEVSVPMSWTNGDGVGIYVYKVDRRAAQIAKVRPVQAGATTMEVLETLKAVVEPDGLNWIEEVSTFIPVLSSLQLGETDKLAIFGTASGLDLPLRIVLAVLASPATAITAVSDSSAQRLAVEHLIKLLRKYAPEHVAWHRIVNVAAEVPGDCSALIAGGGTVPVELLKPGTLVVGHSGCLPGLDISGDGRAILPPSGVEISQVAAIEALDDEMLDFKSLKDYMPGLNQVDARLRLNRLANLLGFKVLRIPARDVARWLRSASNCA